MATSEAIQKHLYCSICLDIFKTPKTLPCLHTFCETCLNDYICKTISSDSKKLCHFECPLCRAKTFPVKTETECHQWAINFVTNHFIVSLVDESLKDSSKLPVEHNQNDGRNCVPCLLDDKMSKASCFCITCSEHLCTICQNDHKKFKVTRNHTVISERDYPKDIAILKEMSNLSHCSAHPEENNQFKCLYHNAFICSLCATTSHKRCDDVIHIDTIPIEKKKDSNECLSKLNTLKESVEKLLASKLNDAEQLESITSRTEKGLNALTEGVQSMVTYMKTDLIADYKGKIGSERNKITSCIANYIEYIEILTNYHDMAESISRYCSNTQKAVFLELLTETENKIRNDLKKQDYLALHDVANTVSVKLFTLKTMLTHWEKDFFSIEKGFSDKLSRTENHPLICLSNTAEACDKHQEVSLATRATFTKTGKTNLCTSTTPAAREDTQNTGQINSVEKETTLFPNCSFRRVSEYDISLPRKSLKVSSHIGILRLANAKLIFLDKNNRILKLVTPNLRICSHETFEDEPFDISQIKHDKIGVATAQKIVVYIVSAEVVRKCNIFPMKSQQILLSLCLLGSNLALLLREKSNKAQITLQVRSKENKILENLTQFSDTSGKSVTLQNPSFVRSHRQQDFIVCEKKQLIMINRQGKITRTFTNGALKSINYIAVASKIGIFLCDTDAGIIHLLPLDMCSASRSLITDLEKPASIVFDDGLQKLFIGCLNSDIVYVYQLISCQ